MTTRPRLQTLRSFLRTQYIVSTREPKTRYLLTFQDRRSRYDRSIRGQCSQRRVVMHKQRQLRSVVLFPITKYVHQWHIVELHLISPGKPSSLRAKSGRKLLDPSKCSNSKCGELALLKFWLWCMTPSPNANISRDLAWHLTSTATQHFSLSCDQALLKNFLI